MPLSPGNKIGAYEIVSQLGAGGMGEVYRARDSKLKRDVAIKVLPADVANDRERLARFQREAEVLASLNHPNIAHVYGVEENALVMELVEGEDLSQRVARGPISIDEVLPIAKQIAEALEAAHDAGIVHRDLKPANVKLKEDGTVKVLDFGLAKAMDEPKGSSLQDSPTITSPAMTMRGVILGTAAYMSPEQAKGKTVDRRADIWAFGCVLYEMLTGTRTFKGDDVTEIITSVMRDQPDWSALPERTPAAVRALLRRCLEKDPRKRAPHIAIARLAIEDSMLTTGDLAGHLPLRQPRLPAWLFAAAAAAVVIAAGAGYWLAQPQPGPPDVVIRSTLILNENLNPRAPSQRFALSPDGKRLAYIAAERASGQIKLWIRSLDGTTSQSMPGTDGATGPFWSPDSQFVAFFAASALKKVAAGGGEPVTIAGQLTPTGFPGTWSRDDVIVFTNAATLSRVPAGGGTPQPITTLNAQQLETGHDYPNFLPDGRHLLYTAFNEMRPIGTFVIPLDGGDAVKLVDQSLNAQYASGYLLFGRDGTVLAQRFDPSTRQLSGSASPLAELVLSNLSQRPGAGFSVSQSGTLVHQTSRDLERNSQLVWSTRTGVRTQISETGAGRGLSISPDGQQLAYAPLDERGRSDVWIFNLARRTRVRLTTTNDSFAPLWTADSRSVIYGTGNSFFRKASNGGSEQRLPGNDPGGFPTSLSPDGRIVLFERTPGDIFAMPTDGSGAVTPVVTTRASERWAQFSPDGRWMAYTSDESGSRQVYIKRSTSQERWQISLNGGNYPRWSRDGSELFFWDPAVVKIVAAKLRISETAVDVDSVTTLFEARPPDGFARYFYDVTQDGRFILDVALGAVVEAKIALTANWPQLVVKK